MSEWDKIKVRDLQRFAAVIEAGSFTGAAAALDETAKHLSRRVASLEEQLGTQLFYRTTRSVRPTIEGTTWYVDVRAILDRLQEATDAVRPSQDLSGLVRMQVPTLFIDDVHDWCCEQLALHPGLSFDLLVGDRSDDLLSRGIDLCLSGIAPSGATLLVRKIGSGHPKLAAHPEYIARRGVPMSPADLVNHECLRFVGPTPQSHWVLTHVSGHSETVPIGGRFACNDSRILQRALHSGMGVGPASTPQQVGTPDVVLRVLLPEWTFGAFPIFLALAPGRSRLPAVRYTADALVRLTQEAIFARQRPV